MKVPRVVKAMEYIDDNLISDANTYKPKKQRFFRSRRWIAAAACLAVFAMALGIFPFFGDKGASPFVMTAYAMEIDGELTAVEMKKIGEPVVLSKIELENGFDGFLFSIPSFNEEDISKVTYLSSAESITPPEDTLNDIIKDKGILYFYYIPAENEEMPVSFTVYVNSDGTELDYKIRIEESDNGYVAIQENASIQTNGGVDGPQSVIVDKK